MAPKTPPAPTVPTAIAARENLASSTGTLEYGIFASGCFWGTEHEFTMFFKHLPNFKATTGYCGGHSDSPDYKQVCTGSTGHAESVKVQYDPSTVGYGELVEFFFRTHDPTTLDRQGGDRGTQYRSAIFTMNESQAKIAKAVRDEVQEKYFSPKGSKVVTQLAEFEKWWDAEDYHQNYLDVNPNGYQCANHKLWW